MAIELGLLKTELEHFGQEHDRDDTQGSHRMLNITRETGEFLSVMVRATAACNILELGTSNGYSALWLAEATRPLDGIVTTVEISDYKVGLATETFSRSGLSDHIRLLQDDAGAALERTEDVSVDLLFLDTKRSEYSRWWPQIRRVLRPGGLLIVDNALSHQQEMMPFIDRVSADADFATSLVPVGKGEFLAVKATHKE